MKNIVVVVNWVMLGLLGAAFIVMVTRYPGAGGAGLLFALAPYATALIALKSTPHRGVIGTSMFFNALFVVFGSLIAVLSVFGLSSGQLRAIFGCLILVVPSALNSKELIQLWEQARESAKSR